MKHIFKRKCEWCKKKFQTTNNIKFHCNPKCTKAHTFDKWRKKNREHFNSLVREGNKIRSKKYYVLRIQNSLCSICGKTNDTELVYCSKCKKRNTNYCREYRRKKKRMLNNYKEVLRRI
jgi:hypothetical protein